VSSLLHLLTDAIEIKWGVGVHLLAPFWWATLDFGLVWPESLLPLSLALVGLVIVVLEWRRPRAEMEGRPVHGTRGAVAAILLGAYFLLPVAFMSAVEAADIHKVSTLRNVGSRPGKTIELDRVVFRPEDGGYVKILAGEKLDVVGPMPSEPGQVSIRGRFLDSQTVEIQEIHRHDLFWRDAASYAGLLLVASIWVRDWRRGRGNRIPSRVAIPTDAP
jgi:hypothetical protein